MASPLCQVKFGAGAYASTTNGINATTGSVVVINLISSIGAPTWAIACVYADDLSTVATVNASLTIDPVGRTATFTAPVAGRGYIFQSVINAGNNLATNQPDPTTATTFGIWVPTASGARVLIPNETFESSATSGWVADVNFPIRNPSSSSGASPVGAAGQLQYYATSTTFGGASNVTYDGTGLACNASGYVTFGAAPPAVGTLRFTYAATDTLVGAKDSTAIDRKVLSRIATDSFLLGDTALTTQNWTWNAFTMTQAVGGGGWNVTSASSANITATGALSITGGSSSFFAIGTTSAAAGLIRVPYNASARSVLAQRDSGNTTDYTIIKTYGLVQTFGDIANSQAHLEGFTIQVNAGTGGSTDFAVGSTDHLYLSGGTSQFGAPIGGNVALSSPLKSAVATVTGAPTSVTATAAQYACPMINVSTGTAVAAFNVVLPLTQGAEWTVTNRSSQTINVGGVTGVTVTILSLASSKCFCPDGANFGKCT